MIYYGLHSNNFVNTSIIRNQLKSRNKFLNKNNFLNTRTLNFNKTQLVLSLPYYWSFIILKSTKSFNWSNEVRFYIFNSTYFFIIPLPTLNWSYSYDANTSSLIISSIYKNNFTLVFWTHLLKIFKSFNRPFFLKLKFKGKGYYIFKNKRNTITPQFGYAHRIYKYTFYVSVKFRTKTSIILFGLLLKDLKTSGLRIKQMRPINIFTGRGVRFNKQIIYKKTGKVSSYR